jgi:hypothetical protein
MVLSKLDQHKCAIAILITRRNQRKQLKQQKQQVGHSLSHRSGLLYFANEAAHLILPWSTFVSDFVDVESLSSAAQCRMCVGRGGMDAHVVD